MRRWERRASWVVGAGILAVLALALPMLGSRAMPAAPREVVAVEPRSAVTPAGPAVPAVPAVDVVPALPEVTAPEPVGTSIPVAESEPPVDTTFAPVQTLRPAVRVSLPAGEGVDGAQAGVSLAAESGEPSTQGPSDQEPSTRETAAREVLAGLDGVRHVAAITVTIASLGGVPAEIAQVQPDEFRPFTPEATANHQPLWDRIEAGDVAVTHEFGTTHEVVLGVVLETGQAGPLRIGAYATNGTPPVADAILLEGTSVGEGSRQLLVALDPEASPTATVEALDDAGFVAEEIPDPRAPRDDIVIPTGGITPENVWDHLVVCEASGNWQINTGNGYYGGLQFLPESWALVGGTGLPHEHPREEQINRGIRLWHLQGWEAWPQCARKLGLIVDPPPPPPGAPPTPSPRATTTE